MSNIEEQIFAMNDYIPSKIRSEFIKRWNKQHKISLEDFLIKISKDPDRKWWIDCDMMFKSYDNYILGIIDSRYPAGISTPRACLIELIEFVDSKLNF